MRLSRKSAALLAVSVLLPLGVAFAQRSGGGTIQVHPGTKTAREVISRNSYGTPEWKNPAGFEKDVFTFARLRYDRIGWGGRNRGGGDWTTDLPDADLNLSFRLQQMTSMKVDPDGRLIRADDPELYKYPFLWASAPHQMTSLNNEEVLGLRKYLTNGGFLLVDDFWGDSAWAAFEATMRRILPELRFQELPIEHQLYQSVFKITEKSQVPNIEQGSRLEHDPDPYGWGKTAEYRHDGDVENVHHRALFDSKGRLVVLALHNTDTGDGWEREGESDYYFHRFAEKISYPLAINILFYVMSH